MEGEAELHWAAMGLTEDKWPPIQVAEAHLAGERFHIRYLMAGGSRVSTAWLETPAGPIKVTASGGVSDLLTAEMPSAGGALTLVVAEVTELPLNAPPLPWRIALVLWPEAVSDWHQAEPCTARLLLPGGASLGVARLLRRSDGLLLFPSSPSHTDARLQILPFIDAELLTAGRPVERLSYPYGDGRGVDDAFEGDWPANSLPGTPDGPPQLVYVPVVRFAPVDPEAPLRLSVPRVSYELKQSWQIEVAVPDGRPAAMLPGLTVSVAGFQMRLEEIFLGRAATFVVLSATGMAPSQDGEIGLRDGSGGEYDLLALSWWKGHLCLVFQPVADEVTDLTLWGEGIRATAPGPCELPLVPPAVVTLEPE